MNKHYEVLEKTKLYKKGFTLVELIIVITILAILATIAFVSFNGYMQDTRDANRLATLKNIENGLQLYSIANNKYPDPDEKINIFVSGLPIGYQGVIGEDFSKKIKFNKEIKDPLDNINYIYATNINKTKYQILAFLEKEDYVSYIPKTYAINYLNRFQKIIGDDIGIILNEDFSLPENDIETTSGNTNYKIFFKNENITSSGSMIFFNLYNREKNLAKYDESLIAFYDMETLTNDGRLKDFSQYNNHGELNGGVEIGGKVGVFGKGTAFDGKDDSVFLSDIYKKIDYTNFSYSVIFETHYHSGSLLNLRGNLSSYNNSIDRKNGFVLIENNQIQFINKGSEDNTQIIKNSHNTILNNQFYIIHVKTQENISKVYLNGILLSELTTQTAGDISLLEDIIYIGEHYYQTINPQGEIVARTHNRFFNGIIDDIKIYNRALSDKEIGQQAKIAGF